MAVQQSKLHTSLGVCGETPHPQQVGPRALQPTALGPVLGPVKTTLVSSGDSAPRPVGRPQDSDSVRAKLKDLGFAFDLGAQLGPLPPTLREVPAAVRRRGQCATASTHCKRGDIFLDLFGGVGRVGKFVSQRGGPNTLLLDVPYGYDILDPRSVADMICIAKSGKLVGIMLAVPCNSFSAARRAPIGSKMPRRLRSDAYPLGLPGLIESDRKVAGVGNDILSAVIRIIKVCDEYGIHWCVENPRSSFLWKMPSMAYLLKQSHTRLHHCHQCQYGCPWMKATSFLSGN